MAAISAELRLNISQFQANIRKAQSSLSQFSQRAVKPLTGATGNLTRAMGGLRGQITGVIGAYVGLQAAIRGTQFGIQVMGGFEQAMDKVQALSGASAEEMAKLTETARKLGAATTFSAREVAQGMGFLAMSGFNAEQQVASIEGVLRMAQVAQMELGRASEITAGALRGFGLDVSETGRVTDVLAKASASAMVDVEMMGQAMKFVAPFASQVGMSFEETIAIIGTLGNSFLQSGLAGRGLAGSLGQMLNVAPAARAELERLGITAEMINPEKLEGGIFEALANLGSVDSDALLALFGSGNFDVGGILKAAKATGELDDLYNKLMNSANEATRMSKVMTDNLFGDLAILKSATEDTFIEFGEQGGKTVSRNFVQDMTAAVEIFREAFKAGQVRELVETSLKVGFGKALAFFQSQLEAVIRSVQNGLTAIGTEGFWADAWDAFRGIGELLVAAGANLGATIFDGMAKAVEPLIAATLFVKDKLTGVFDILVGGMKQGVLEIARWVAEKFGEKKLAKSLMAPSEAAAAQIGRGNAALSRSFNDQRDRASLLTETAAQTLHQVSSDLLRAGLDRFGVDITAAQTRLDELVKALKPAPIESAVRENTKPVGKLKAQPVPTEGILDQGLGGFGMDLGSIQALVGGVQAATNMIFGRSANELIVMEAQRTNSLLEQNNSLLKDIRDRDPKPRVANPPAAQRAVFSAG